MTKNLAPVALLVLMAVSGCAHMGGRRAIALPPGIDGYQCYRREKSGDVVVYAEAYPDYRGGYASLTMVWETRKAPGDPEVRLVWTRGRKAIAPPGWLSVNMSVQGTLPPLHSKMFLRLSNGQVLEREFIEPKTWRQWQRSAHRWAGFGGLIHSTEPAVMAAFSEAVWADVEVIDPQGITHARARLDLSHLQDELAVLRRLGDEVLASVADYANRCAPIHIEVDTF